MFTRCLLLLVRLLMNDKFLRCAVIRRSRSSTSNFHLYYAWHNKAFSSLTLSLNSEIGDGWRVAFRREIVGNSTEFQRISLKILKYRTLYIIIHINSHELRYTIRTVQMTRYPCKRYNRAEGKSNKRLSLSVLRSR